MEGVWIASISEDEREGRDVNLGLELELDKDSGRAHNENH
jgi:hypothetical protein